VSFRQRVTQICPPKGEQRKKQRAEDPPGHARPRCDDAVLGRRRHRLNLESAFSWVRMKQNACRRRGRFPRFAYRSHIVRAPLDGDQHQVGEGDDGWITRRRQGFSARPSARRGTPAEPKTRRSPFDAGWAGDKLKAFGSAGFTYAIVGTQCDARRGNHIAHVGMSPCQARPFQTLPDIRRANEGRRHVQELVAYCVRVREAPPCELMGLA
jgi:hypothetical protein